MHSLRAVLFDVFGTLLDVQSVALHAERLFPAQGAHLAQVWREKQIEYTRLRSLSGRYVSFTRITEDALRYSCAALGLRLDAAAAASLMQAYTRLAPFPDAVPALRELQERKVELGVLSNGDAALLKETLRTAGLDGYLHFVLSADEAQAFKTAPAVYALGPRRLGRAPEAILFVSSNGWDAIGAKWFGYASYWVNRAGVPMEQLGVQPDATGRTLTDAARFFLNQH